ncbi:1210_t:CDS:2 [Paraglomus brasilianum]|uniref:1210_t:CDS:1 n=1 Tax=Paraglomus brasilianum TaxID=144538 RepID=A0A9N9ADG5_9GLOM|nr:1210_t:CDS:2 [Paraglomus brasilianum]
MEYALLRMQNSVEAWHQRWDTLCKKLALSDGQQSRQVVARETRIQTVFNNRDQMPLMDFLRGIAHNI